jgi:hypothetical protein
LLADKEVCFLFDMPCELKDNTKCNQCNLYIGFCKYESNEKENIEMKNTDEGKYTKIFVYPNGEEVKVLETYHGRYINSPIQIIYTDKKRQYKNQYMSETFNKPEYKERLFEKTNSYYDKKTNELYYGTVTYVIAEDKNWQEYKTVNYYDEQCSNTLTTTKAEIVLQTEEYSRRLFKEWTGNTTCYDLIQNLPDELWDDFCEKQYDAKYYDEDEMVQLEFYTNNGESAWIEIYNEHDIEKMIISVRVIEFKNEIVE